MAQSEALDEKASHRRDRNGENRFPPAIAVVVAAAAYALLPESLLIGPRFVIPIIELVLLGALMITNPTRFVRQTRWSRTASTVLASVVIAANLVALGILISKLITPGPSGSIAAAGGGAGLADQRDRFRPAVLGAGPRWSGGETQH